jgi:hypothetical protein
VTDQSQSGPPEPPDDGSGSTGDVPAALGPDSPTQIAPAPPPPPAAIATAMDEQDVEVPPAVAPPAPGDSTVVSPAPVPPRSEPPAWRPEDDLSSGGPAALAAERPEVAVGAAFAGGLVLALILKRLAR